MCAQKVGALRCADSHRALWLYKSSFGANNDDNDEKEAAWHLVDIHMKPSLLVPAEKPVVVVHLDNTSSSSSSAEWRSKKKGSFDLSPGYIAALLHLLPDYIATCNGG